MHQQAAARGLDGDHSRELRHGALFVLAALLSSLLVIGPGHFGSPLTAHATSPTQPLSAHAAWSWGTPNEIGQNATSNSVEPAAMCVVGGTAPCTAANSNQLKGVTGIYSAGASSFGYVTTTSGTYAWGQQGYSCDVLGETGTPVNESVPSAVPLLNGISVASVSVDSNSNINTSEALFLTTSGTVYSVGCNGSGQLGDGTTVDTGNKPGGPAISQVCAVSGCGSHLSNIVAVAAGGDFSLALGSNGTVYAWGNGANGALGNGSSTGQSTIPVAVCAAAGCASGSLTGITAIAAGSVSAEALTSTGAVYSWGSNASYVLGDGDTTASDIKNLPTAVCAVSGCGSQLTGVTAITIGGAGPGPGLGVEYAFALGPGGAVIGWGYDYDGELGAGPSAPYITAVPINAVGTSGSGILAGITGIAAGGWHGVAVTYTGAVLTWGGSSGRDAVGLGYGGVIQSKVPVPADPDGTNGSTLDQVTGVAASYNSSFGAVTAAPLGGPILAQELLGLGNGCYACAVQNWLVHAGAADPVDTATGNFTHSFVDITIPGRSYPLGVTRTYNSLAAPANGPFGYGWNYNYGMSLSCSGTTATITQETGSQVSFTTTGSCSSGTWTAAAPRFIATLSYSGGTWTFKRHNRDTFTFNSSGQLTSETDLNGYTTTLSYTSGNLTSVTDPAGRSLSFGWTGSTITSITDANVNPNRTLAFSYDGSGNLQDVTDVNGGDTHFTYDTSHRMTVMKDPVCQAAGSGCPGIQNHYDAMGRVDWQKDQLNRQTTFAYTGAGATSATDPKGNVTVDYYVDGLRASTTKGYGTSSAATWTYGYDPSSVVLTTTTDPNSHTTTQTVDANGNVLTTTDPLGHVTTNTYNSYNELLTTQDGKGVTTTNTYDTHGNLSTSSTPVTGTSCPCEVTTYNHANGTYPGDVTSMVDGDGKTTSYSYDTYGDRAQVTDPLGNTTTAVYNGDGWPATTYSPKASAAAATASGTVI